VRVIACPWTRHAVALPSGLSSQYASALLLCAARAGGVDLTLVGDTVSDGYLGLTCAVLERFGVPVARDGPSLRVAPGAPRATRFVVEADASSAAPWWAAAALTGGTAVVEGVPWGTCQPDAALLSVLERMGASVQPTPDGWVRVDGPGGPLRGAGDVDLRASPDLAPVVGALAAGAAGETRVVRAPHLRFKESDRVASVVAAVRAVGGDADGREDGFVVRGRPLSGGRVAVTGDHRIVLAFGVLGLVVPGVVLDGAQAVEKSYPGFLADLGRAGGEEGGPSRDRP
jgi:3-phosphoshikimate 1-carboxyvinyltransferase